MLYQENIVFFCLITSLWSAEFPVYVAKVKESLITVFCVLTASERLSCNPKLSLSNFLTEIPYMI